MKSVRPYASQVAKALGATSSFFCRNREKYRGVLDELVLSCDEADD